MTSLELLAPARDLECGKAAIDCGADAVYIGAERFGARAAVGNSVDDIAELCRYAHRFRAKVFVTVNTIVFDNELEDTERLLDRLEDAGVDAILVQDMALVDMLRSRRMAMHASTQTDNRSAEKVRWLHNQGFKSTVLARELSAEEISMIHTEVPEMPLEVFVHGALCVSYSGLCYASQHCFGRSANRGTCAQFCRLKFNLVDSDGEIIEEGRYLLSLKDMNQSKNIGRLIEAGATSFKIEGRLKDVAYVKNVTSAYSKILDEYIDKHPGEYCRASLGHCRYMFTPDLAKTFNRGFTTYFLNGRQPGIVSPNTPKAIGEYVGKVKELRGQSFNVAGTSSFANGDGLCFINDNQELVGFRVNRVEGNRLFPLQMPRNLRPGTALYRNNDKAFEDILSHQVADRRIPVNMELSATDNGFALTISVQNTDITTTATITTGHQQAKKPQHDGICTQLSKLGNTVYECVGIKIPDGFDYFIPNSLLSDLRRQACENLTTACEDMTVSPDCGNRLRNALSIGTRETFSRPPYHSTTELNIANDNAHSFYVSHGVSDIRPSYEIERNDGPLMQCRHCLRYSLGYCVKNGGNKPTWREPLFLTLPDSRRFRLEFDCKNCQMNVYAE